MTLRLLVLLTSSFIHGPPQADDVDSHIAALKSGDKEKRIAAARTLEKLGPKAVAAIPALVECLDDDRPETYDVRVGTLCARALVAIGKPAIQPVVKALESKDPKMFAGAAQAVMLMQPPPESALEVLFDALAERTEGGNKAAKPRQRGWVAARTLVVYGPKALPATGDLIEMLHSENFHEQIAACDALGGIGPGARRAAPRLVHLVSEGNTSARGKAALALGGIGLVEDVDILPAIEKATRDFSAVVRGRAMMALALLGPKAKPALPTVHKYLRSKSYRNRTEAAYAAWKITGDATEPVEILSELAGNLDTELDALLVLGKMGTAAAEAAPVLLEMLDSEDPDKRFEIVQTLKFIAPARDDVRDKLAELAKSDPDADVRRAATLKTTNGLPK